jgi:hypothetical protein
MITQTASPSLHSSATSRSALPFSNSPEEPYEVYERQGETIFNRLHELNGTRPETLVERVIRFVDYRLDTEESVIEMERRLRG